MLLEEETMSFYYWKCLNYWNKAWAICAVVTIYGSGDLIICVYIVRWNDAIPSHSEYDRVPIPFIFSNVGIRDKKFG